MRNTAKNINNWKFNYTNVYLLGYEHFLSLKIKLAVTFSLIRFLAVWSNLRRYLWQRHLWCIFFNKLLHSANLEEHEGHSLQIGESASEGNNFHNVNKYRFLWKKWSKLENYSKKWTHILSTEYNAFELLGPPTQLVSGFSKFCILLAPTIIMNLISFLKNNFQLKTKSLMIRSNRLFQPFNYFF